MSGGKAPNSQDFRVLREMAEVLAGKRGDKNKAAMTRGEAKDLREFIAALRKGTADVQTELNEIVGTVAQTRDALDSLSGDITATQDGLADANLLLDSLQSAITAANNAITAANTAISSLSTNATNVVERLEEISEGAEDAEVQAVLSGALTLPPTADDFNTLRNDMLRVRQLAIGLRSALT